MAYRVVEPGWRDELPTHCACGAELVHQCPSRTCRFCSLKCAWRFAVGPASGAKQTAARQSRLRERWPDGVITRPMPTPQQVARFWSQVQKGDNCWLFVGRRMNNGYGWFEFKSLHRFSIAAHRLSYLLASREIPDGYDLDHLCRVRNCVNPAHLEPVTRGENLRRGHAARKGCAA